MDGPSVFWFYGGAPLDRNERRAGSYAPNSWLTGRRWHHWAGWNQSPHHFRVEENISMPSQTPVFADGIPWWWGRAWARTYGAGPSGARFKHRSRSWPSAHHRLLHHPAPWLPPVQTFHQPPSEPKAARRDQRGLLRWPRRDSETRAPLVSQLASRLSPSHEAPGPLMPSLDHDSESAERP